MKKNIKIRFVYPQNNEHTHAVRKNIQQFYHEVLTSYVNGLDCSCADKEYITEHIVSTIRTGK